MKCHRDTLSLGRSCAHLATLQSILSGLAAWHFIRALKNQDAIEGCCSSLLVITPDTRRLGCLIKVIDRYFHQLERYDALQFLPYSLGQLEVRAELHDVPNYECNWSSRP